MFKKYTLKNGLRIILVPQKHSQSVTILVLVGAGSKYESKEISGISHFLEHLYFKGTKKRPSLLAVSETLDKIGGSYNAFTGEDYTGYFAKVAFSHFEIALDWVSDIYLNSLLPEKEIEKEKGVVTEEINMIFDNPMSHLHLLWSELLYGDQPAGWPIIGTKESVGKITRPDLLNYRQKNYMAENTVICLAGNINQKEALNKIKKYFSKINTSSSFQKPKVLEKQEKPEVILYHKKTDQTHFSLGVRTFNLFHPQKDVLRILEIILGGMMSSRLFIELRDKLGIAYYVSTYSETNPDTGYLTTRAGVDNKKIKEGIKTILKEYQKISQKKVSFQELKKAKDYLKGNISLGLETSDSQAIFYTGQELLEKRILTPKEIFKKIDKVSQNDIIKVAGDIFKPEKLNLALIGHFKDKTIFQRLLKF